MEAILSSLAYSAWATHFRLWSPLLAAAAVLAGPGARARHIAFGAALVEFLVSIPLWMTFNPASAAFQFASAAPWIPQWGIYYRLGIDGIALPLVMLTTLLTPIAILGSYQYIQHREKTFYSMMLVLETGVDRKST